MHIEVSIDYRLQDFLSTMRFMRAEAPRKAQRLERPLGMLAILGVCLGLVGHFQQQEGVVLIAFLAVGPALIYWVGWLARRVVEYVATRTRPTLDVTVRDDGLSAAYVPGPSPGLEVAWLPALGVADSPEQFLIFVPPEGKLLVLPKRVFTEQQRTEFEHFIRERALIAWSPRSIHDLQTVDQWVAEATTALAAGNAAESIELLDRALALADGRGGGSIVDAQLLKADALARDAPLLGAAHIDDLVATFASGYDVHVATQLAVHAWLLRAGALGSFESNDAEALLTRLRQDGQADESNADHCLPTVALWLTCGDLDEAIRHMNLATAQLRGEGRPHEVSAGQVTGICALVLAGREAEAAELWEDLWAIPPGQDDERCRVLCILAGTLYAARDGREGDLPRVAGPLIRWATPLRDRPERQGSMEGIVDQWISEARDRDQELCAADRYHCAEAEGYLHLIHGRLPQSSASFATARETPGLSPNLVATAAHTESIVLAATGDLDAALHLLDDARGARPNLPHSAWAGMTHEAARAAVELGQTDQALIRYQEAATMHEACLEGDYADDCRQSIALIHAGATSGFRSGGLTMHWPGVAGA